MKFSFCLVGTNTRPTWAVDRKHNYFFSKAIYAHCTFLHGATILQESHLPEWLSDDKRWVGMCMAGFKPISFSAQQRALGAAHPHDLGGAGDQCLDGAISTSPRLGATSNGLYTLPYSLQI